MRASPPGPSPEHRHRALANRQRVRLLELLRAADDGADAHVLSAELGLHLNTVRSHLGILEQAGMVVSEPEERRVRGRPRIIYRLDPNDAPAEHDGHSFLATVLVDGLSTLDEAPAELVSRAGERWAKRRAGRDELTSDASWEEILAHLRGLLAELGFAPATDPDEPRVIELRACPFRELAAENPEIVCSAHHGVLRGVLAGAGDDVDVDLVPFVTPTTCLVHVA